MTEAAEASAAPSIVVFVIPETVAALTDAACSLDDVAQESNMMSGARFDRRDIRTQSIPVGAGPGSQQVPPPQDEEIGLTPEACDVLRGLFASLTGMTPSMEYATEEEPPPSFSSDADAAEDADADAEDADTEDADTEDADAEDADTEDADAEDADTEDADAEDADAEDADTEDADAEDADTEDADSEDQVVSAVSPESPDDEDGASDPDEAAAAAQESGSLTPAGRTAVYVTIFAGGDTGEGGCTLGDLIASAGGSVPVVEAGGTESLEGAADVSNIALPADACTLLAALFGSFAGVTGQPSATAEGSTTPTPMDMGDSTDDEDATPAAAGDTTESDEADGTATGTAAAGTTTGTPAAGGTTGTPAASGATMTPSMTTPTSEAEEDASTEDTTPTGDEEPDDEETPSP
jgi:hypothetical protein